MKKKRASLTEFLAALDVVRESVLQWSELLGAVPAPASEASDPPRPASLRPKVRAIAPKGSWRKAVRAVLKTATAPVSRAEIVQKIADVKGVPPSTVSGIIGNTLYEMKKEGQVKHDSEKSTYELVETGSRLVAKRVAEAHNH